MLIRVLTAFLLLSIYLHFDSQAFSPCPLQFDWCSFVTFITRFHAIIPSASSSACDAPRQEGSPLAFCCLRRSLQHCTGFPSLPCLHGRLIVNSRIFSFRFDWAFLLQRSTTPPSQDLSVQMSSVRLHFGNSIRFLIIQLLIVMAPDWHFFLCNRLLRWVQTLAWVLLIRVQVRCSAVLCRPHDRMKIRTNYR